MFVVRSNVTRARDERGFAYPSPLVMLSVVAVAMAGIAFVATKDQPETERQITPASAPQSTPSETPTIAPEPEKQPQKPRVQRAKVYVEVYNNTSIQGLAGRVSDRATDIGWQVVGSDNWVGTIPANTVYFPPRLKAAGRQLALDLGIRRVQPAVGAMKLDRLTIVLTGEL
jgi:hypothetical protein